MIPRYQKILFFVLLVASLGHGRQCSGSLRDRAHKRLLAGETTAPTKAPLTSLRPNRPRFLVANDADNSLTRRRAPCPCPPIPAPVPAPSSAELLDLYAAPDCHPPCPRRSSLGCPGLPPARSRRHKSCRPRRQLAVVNLTGTFAASHPSGLETESLTVLSICATIHANLPNVAQVRFLVDGQPRPTLAGHADLTRTYLTAEATPTEGNQP